MIALIQTHAPGAARVGLESGPTSPWLWRFPKGCRGLPVVCMDARHAHAALSVRPSKSDRNRCVQRPCRDGADGVGTERFRSRVSRAHERMALLGVRRRLVDMRIEIDGQICGILKTFGLVVGSVATKVLSPNAHGCSPKTIHRSCRRSSTNADRSAGGCRCQGGGFGQGDPSFTVRDDLTLRRFMTVPGVGPVTALAFRSTIDEPNRFKRAFGMSVPISD